MKININKNVDVVNIFSLIKAILLTMFEDDYSDELRS